ncbi:MAG: type VI secretion system baseplate subunit TssE [Proteobacteria bacterium]|nr:type VI secretion system baseplate subunit TssE [Pseudomonadota bacterium]
MKQTKINRGTLPPLFDRIVDDTMGLGVGSQLLNADELKASIVNELSLVLNTRCTVRKVIYEDHLESIPLFGLPDFFGMGDFSYFDGSNSQDWPKAARFIETAIQAAEPRLENVRVSVDGYDPVNQVLSTTVWASVKKSPLLKDIHFPLAISHQPPPSLQKSAA